MAYDYDTGKFEHLLQQVADNEPSLKTLSLRGAGLNKEDITRLSEALVGNTYITELDLSANDITDGGVNILMAALAQNNTITTLYLCRNDIGLKGPIAFLEALKKNTTLIHFECYNKDGPGIPAAIHAAIQEELSINRACQQVIKEHIQALMSIRSLEPTSL